MGTSWVLVRHGESTANAEGWLAGHADTPLTARGHAQAVALGAQLPVGIDRVFASDLVRARDTARLAVPGMPVQVDARLRERHIGAWVGESRARLKAEGAFRCLLTWTDGPPGGESQQALARRVLPWFVERGDDGGTTLVVAHGGVLRVVVGLLDGVPLEAIGRWNIRNTEVLVREASGTDWARALARA